MGDIEKGIEGLVPSDECWMACERVLERAETYRFGAGLCERIQFLDAEHKEHVRGRQVVQLCLETSGMGTNRTSKAGSLRFTYCYGCDRLLS